MEEVKDGLRCMLVTGAHISRPSAVSPHLQFGLPDLPGVAKVHGAEAERADPDGCGGREHPVPSQEALGGRRRGGGVGHDCDWRQDL